jgi:hypothetical protein
MTYRKFKEKIVQYVPEIKAYNDCAMFDIFLRYKLSFEVKNIRFMNEDDVFYKFLSRLLKQIFIAQED